MAWIVPLPPTPRRPKQRWQVRYRDAQGVERSGGIYTTEHQAKTWKRNIEKGKFPPNPSKRKRREPAGQARSDPAATAPAALATFGDFVDRWWPTWKTLHPQSATAKFYLLNQRILPTSAPAACPAPTPPPWPPGPTPSGDGRPAWSAAHPAG